MGRTKAEYETASGIRRLLISLYMQLSRGEIDVKTATAQSNILYKVLATIQEDRKSEEIEVMQELKAKLDKLGG